MATNPKPNWFSRASISKQQLPKCPRCNSNYPFGPLFDHHPRVCPSCKLPLIEWALTSVIYLIDFEQAPPIVKNLITYLGTLPEPEAEQELECLVNFLQKETATKPS